VCRRCKLNYALALEVSTALPKVGILRLTALLLNCCSLHAQLADQGTFSPIHRMISS
jgi:hypothetical protein